MEIKKFKYNGKLREVVCTEVTPTSIKGFDLSYLDEEKKEEARKLAESLQVEDGGLLPEEGFGKLKEYGKFFRHFLTAKIEPLEK